MKRQLLVLTLAAVLMAPTSALAMGIKIHPSAHQTEPNGALTFQVRLENDSNMGVYGIRFPLVQVLDREGNVLAEGPFTLPGDPLYRQRIPAHQSLTWNLTFAPWNVFQEPTDSTIQFRASATFYQSPDVYVEGKRIESDVPAIIRTDDQRTYMPLRAVAEALGATVTWNSETSEAILTYRGRQLVYQIGKASYTLDGQTYEMDAAPFLLDGRTMVPVRPAAEAFGMTVRWDGTLGRVQLSR